LAARCGCAAHRSDASNWCAGRLRRRRSGNAGTPGGVPTGLEQLGWFEGRNIRFDIRFAPAGTGQEHSASLAATFEGEFSDVTRSYAGKGVARYSR
jgi:hypothetical protein